ncbi:MAG: prepilin-type N-terminal cleavage/methylation domain-containing protein [Planctomycetes bacterium]|nr:prepilin-type N-terminal cleavage/methylation domain-containing protein [Planctomycetota bacterium]
MKSRSKSGFTLVEILIVVVILGILAAIVIPQFSQASSEARVSSVKSNLQMVRSQIELYKIQHGDVLPAGTATELVTRLTTKTNYNGAAYTAAMELAGDPSYGPYMQKWPVNAVSQLGSGVTAAGVPDGSEISVVITDPAVDALDAANGWIYNNVDGTFFAVDATVEMCNW